MDKKKARRESVNLSRNRLNMIFNALYLKMRNMKVIKNYIHKIRMVYKLIYPADEFTINVLTVSMIIKSFCLSLGVFILGISFGKLHVYGYMILLIMIIVINSEVVNAGFSKLEIKLLRQLEEYLSEVRHHYHMNGILEDAIFDSLEYAKPQVALHINIIYNILIENDKDRSEKYMDIAPNKFFMTFLALCETVMMFGDTVKDNESLFLENINSLREEIRTELLKRDRISHVFSGLVIISILPPFTLKIIEKWGISNIPKLVDFYDGRYGLIVSIIICLLSLGAYSLINRMKDNYRYQLKYHWILEKICSVQAINDIVVRYMYKNAVAVKALGDKLRRASEDITVRQFIVRRYLIMLVSFVSMLVILFYGNTLESASSIKIPDFKLYMVPVVFFASICVGYLPDMFVDMRMYFLRQSMENEVLSFHSIIIMLMHIKRVDAGIILEWMENFSDIFKTSIRECVDNYFYDEDEALEKLKVMEPYPPFVRIIENLQASDVVGIEKAFEEIYSQRHYFVEKRKQDNEISISNKGAIGRFIAFIPMVATIGLYLIIPFVMESITELMGCATQMR